jgi:hypothetical protein
MKSALRAGVIRALAVTLLAALLPASTGSAQQPPPDRWSFRFTPYLWLPSVDGTLNYSLPSGDGIDLPLGPEDYTGNIEFGFAAGFEARRGNWSILIDGIYVDLSGRATVATLPVVPGGPGVHFDADVDFTQFLGGGAIGYTVARSDTANLDVFGGVRYNHLDTAADLDITGPLPGTLPTLHFERDIDIWDGIAGVRGRVGLGGNWALPYYVDVGTGDSNFTWQAMTGVGYGWSWGELLLVYRHLSYDLDNKIVEDLELSGPALAISFRF